MPSSDARRAIFITGAASGIGRETARLFAGHGWLVGAHDVQTDLLAELEKELGRERCHVRELDVTRMDDFGAAVEEFGKRSSGRMDVLYNNAGIGHSGWFEDVPYEATRRLIDVNLVGVVNGIYAALPLLRATENALCFSTSSSSATYGMPRIAVYSATKFAVKGLTEALSIEFSRLGVRVADTLPGLIDTPILENTPNHSGDTPQRFRPQDAAPEQGPFRLVHPREVAEVVWQAYHDTTGRLHWYVPAEIQMLDQAKAMGAESVRDQIQAQMTAATAGTGTAR